MKNPEDPFLVELDYIDSSLKYTEEEMMTNFPILESEIMEVKQYE